MHAVCPESSSKRARQVGRIIPPRTVTKGDLRTRARFLVHQRLTSRFLLQRIIAAYLLRVRV